MTTSENRRDLEQGIEVDLRDRLTYGGYLQLDRLLSAQQPLSQPPHHDEMLFIIQHQVSELWMKLLLHELAAAIGHVKADRLAPCFKILARVKQVQRQLFEQWAVLETLTPSEYALFRNVLGPASGLQSHQFRAIEFMLGNKNARLVDLQKHDPEVEAYLLRLLNSPSLYDEFLRYLARQGYPVPAALLDRDVTRAHVFTPELVPVFVEVYRDEHDHWPVYEACEELVDLEDNFQIWRFRHLRTVARTIGNKTGTGGSSGTDFLQRALDLTFFPELYAVRTQL